MIKQETRNLRQGLEPEPSCLEPEREMDPLEIMPGTLEPGLPLTTTHPLRG